MDCRQQQLVNTVELQTAWPPPRRVQNVMLMPEQHLPLLLFLPHTNTPPNQTHSILGPHFHNRARITDEMMGKLMELPGTRGLGELRARAEDLTTWKLALQKGWVGG